MESRMSAREIVDKLNISRSTFYYMIKNGIVNLEQTASGRYVWNENVCAELKNAIKDKEIQCQTTHNCICS